MKIVNIILTSQNGGAEQVFIDYANVLKYQLGHEVLSIVKNDAPYANQLSEINLPYKKIPNKFGDFDFCASKKIKKIIEEFEADIVIAHVGRSMVLVRRALKKIKNKKIFLIAVNHSMNVKRSIGSDIIISVNKQIFYRTVDLGQDPQKSFVVHNAIDLSNAIEIPQKIDLRNKQTIVLGGLGRLDKYKAFRFTIKAIPLLEKKFPDKKFIVKIGGEGPRKTFLLNLTKEMRLEEKVKFLGWVKNKKEFYDSIDVFILSSQRETFGLVILEAMKFRKPVISTSCDGPKEIIKNEVDGLLVELEPVDNTETRIADAVEKLINNPELLEKIQKQSFIHLKERFSLASIAKSLGEIIGHSR